MLRAVLVGVLSLSAVACKSKSDSPQAQPGGVAGKVVEVSGAVTLRHGDVARPLASGDSVEGDDVIETGADGSVVIELAHNLARWELGANRKAKVRESTAWGLPKKSGEGAYVEQNSAAAGRHAERSAAETGVSAESAPAPATAAPPPSEPAAAPTAAPPPPPPKPAGPARGRMATSGDEKSDGKTAEKAKLSADVLDQESGGGGGSMPPSALANRAAHEVVLRHRSAIQACLTKDMPTVAVRVTVDATGKATVEVKSKTDVPDAVKSCVTSALDKAKFAAAEATVTIVIAK